MTETFEIDGRPVPASEFKAFLETLKELPRTWFCDETTDGGDTGYDAVAPDGTVWEYRVSSDRNGNTSTLRRRK